MSDNGTNTGSGYQPAADPVECASSPNGKHAPRTVEGGDSNGVHTKTSVCHHCQQIA